MLQQAHFLLTYQCTSQCDHCFVNSSPESIGTFTITQIREVLSELVKTPAVEWVYFEGGEPFLYYPIMTEGIRAARELGFNAGIVTNAYWASSPEDARVWLEPLRELGVLDFSVSDDVFHRGEGESPGPRIAMEALEKIGMPGFSICIEEPAATLDVDGSQEKGAVVTGGKVKFRGRAAEMLTDGFPVTKWDEFEECPYEDLQDPKRVHLDSYGNVHLCQGLSMGNMWETPLSQLVKDYDPGSHPVCAPLLDGGPAELARRYGMNHDNGYVDACHLCYSVRKALVGRFGEYLAPKQVYGLDQSIPV